MSDIPRPKSNKEEPEPTDAKDDSLIVNPINIARARHASAHGQSVVEQAKHTATRRMKVTPPPTIATSATASNKLAETIAGSNGCLFISLLGMAFMVGGIIGGLVGGGLLLSVSGESVALWSEPVTPTPSPTPTSVPVETLTPTPSPQPSPTPAMEDIIAEIIPSVVTIVNQQNLNLSFRPEDGRVVGSGVIVDGRGYIATNNHVVEGARELRVVLADGRDVIADLVVADPTEDLAIIKITADNILPIKWGDSSSVRPGQSVYAIGSPLGDFPSSVSFGIVSGLNRALEMDEHVIDGLIQTDAAINRGSSGGPLINIQGEMIGINTFIIRESEDRGVAEGIAFALPTHTAKDILFPWIAAHSGESVPIPAGESN